MEFKDLKNKDKKELQGLLLSNREKLRELRFKDSNKQLKNVGEIRAIKVLIAQILTLLNKQK
jgi:ribosomal protein L29